MDNNKLKQLKEELKKAKLDGLVVSSALNIAYLTGFTNFSIHEREAYLFITEKRQFIFTDGRYTEAVAKQVQEFDLVEISRKTSFVKVLKRLARQQRVKKVGVEEDDLRVDEYKPILKAFKNVAHFDAKGTRSIKTEEEIKAIKRSCQLGDRALAYVLKKIKAGVTEKELADGIETFVKKSGGELSFPTIVAFGTNASVPHHQTGQTKLDNKKGQFVLIDMGTKVNGYCSDMTRCFFWGKPSAKQRQIYKTVLEAQTKAAEYVDSYFRGNDTARGRYNKDKLTGFAADKVARDYITSKGFSAYSHGLGHGVGLEVHEPPHLSSGKWGKHPLKEGMVFSIEPGIYIPDFGGVRIEDLFVLEKTGLRQLTKFPKQIIEL